MGKAAKKEETKFKVKSDIKDVGSKKSPLGSGKSKGVNRIKAGIEQARELDTSSGSNKAFRKDALEPLKIDPKKLEQLDNKLQESDDFDLLGFNDSEGKKKFLNVVLELIRLLISGYKFFKNVWGITRT
jgi:hypothetical protein